MTLSAMRGQVHGRGAFWWTFPLHQIVSIVGVAILSGMITFDLMTTSRAQWLLTETHFFPVQIGVAFLVGFLLHRYLLHRVMQWVWVLPFLFLCVCFGLGVKFVSFDEYSLPVGKRVALYFGTSCRPEDRCFVQLAITLPFYTAASYSLAAFLSRTLARQKHQSETLT
jgi:hypothetical protein